MIVIYIIQTCLFILGVIPLLCELSRYFQDSLSTMFARFVVFLISIVFGYYAPHLEKLPVIISIVIAMILSYFSYTTLRDIVIVYKQKKLIRHTQEN